MKKNQRYRRSLIAVKTVEPLESWPSGRNEDANRLSRLCFCKETDFAENSQARPNKVAHLLDRCPHEILESENLTERINVCVASIG